MAVPVVRSPLPGYSELRWLAAGLAGVGLGWGCPELSWGECSTGCLLGALGLGMLGRVAPLKAAWRCRHLAPLLAWVSLTAGLASLQGQAGDGFGRRWLTTEPVPPSPPPYRGNLGTPLLLVQVVRQEGQGRYRARILDQFVEGGPHGIWHRGRVGTSALLRLPPHERCSSGDCVLLDARHALPLAAPTYPGQADLRTYYLSQGIATDLQLTRNAFYLRLQGHHPRATTEAGPSGATFSKSVMDLYRFKPDFPLLFGGWQERAAALMDQHLKDSVGLALSKALLLGWRADLSKELRKAFQDSGTVHLLAVSGMHVLLLYQMLQYVLKALFMGFHRLRGYRSKVYKPPLLGRFVLSSLLILGYCLLTGAAPSALRAGIGIVWIQGNQLLHGGKNAGSALAVVGLLMVVMDPLCWQDPGFQLSFAAVAGLLWGYAPLWNRLRAKNWPLPGRTLASLLGMSLMAQAATAPLCLYHFGQFPNYFLVANLILVPLATPLLVLAIAWPLGGWIPFLGPLLDGIGSLLFGWTAEISAAVSAWPGAISHHWDFRSLDLCFSGLLVGTMVLPLHLGKWHLGPRQRLSLILSVLLVWMCCRTWRQQNEALQTSVAIFGHYRQSCVLIRGPSGILWSADAAGLADSRPLKWLQKLPSIRSHPLQEGLTAGNDQGMLVAGPLQVWVGQQESWMLPESGQARRIVHLQGPGLRELSAGVDLLVLSRGALATWPTGKAPRMLVVAGGQRFGSRKRLAARACAEGIRWVDLSP